MWSRLLCVAGILVICSAPSAWSDIYRYVDANGVIHFTNTPNSPKYKLYMKEGRENRGLLGSSSRSWSSSSWERLQRFDPLIGVMAKRYGLDEALVTAVIKVESDFDHQAVSRKGALGLMQLMPFTARDLGVRDVFDPIQNLEGGVRHLRYLLDFFKGRLDLALAAYNAGRDAVLQHGGIPPYPETQQYVKLVLQYHDLFQRETARQDGLRRVSQNKEIDKVRMSGL